MQSSFSAKSIRRTESIRVPSYNKEIGRPHSPSSASTSSATSHNHNVELETKQTASTSAIQPENELHPLIEGKSNRVRFSDSASLIDPNAGTHVEHLDPARDGAFARMRMRNKILGYGSAIVIGSAVGAAGFAAKEILLKNDSIAQPMNTSRNQTDFDSILNPI